MVAHTFNPSAQEAEMGVRPVWFYRELKDRKSHVVSSFFKKAEREKEKEREASHPADHVTMEGSAVV